jgi:hypothetical protein
VWGKLGAVREKEASQQAHKQYMGALTGFFINAGQARCELFHRMVPSPLSLSLSLSLSLYLSLSLSLSISLSLSF